MTTAGLKSRTLALFVVGLAVLLVGCDREGGSIFEQLRTPGLEATPSYEAPGAAKTPTPTPRSEPTPEISEGDLETMVLTLADLGDAYLDFERDSEYSGPQTRADLIDDACNPEDEADDLDRTGWVAAYSQFYAIPDYELSGILIGGADETMVIQSVVYLFSDEEGAADRFRDETQESQEEAYTECQEVSLGQVSEFDVPRVGDEAWGGVVDFKMGSYIDEGTITAVALRRDRIIAILQVMRIGSDGDPEEAIRLARILDGRIATRLSGEEPPVPSPVPALRPGVDAEVFGAVTCLNARKAPKKSAEIVKCLVDGTVVRIEDGPVDADGYRWWKLQGLGWAAENWLRPRP